MKLTTALLTVSAAFAAVHAADICRPTGSDCFGSAVCCNGIQEGNCCNLGGASTRIRMKVPANSRSQGFTSSGCTGSVATNSNSQARTVCFTYGSSRSSGKWLTGASKSRMRRELESGTEACAEPNAVLRVRDGVTTRIDLTNDMTIEEALIADGGVVVDSISFEGQYEVASDD